MLARSNVASAGPDELFANARDASAKRSLKVGSLQDGVTLAIMENRQWMESTRDVGTTVARTL